MRFLVLFFVVGSLVSCHTGGGPKTSQNTPVPDATASESALRPILRFDADSVLIKEPELVLQNAGWLKNNPDKVVVLEGHCDERGDREYNLKLGDERARVVMEALIKEGVPDSQLVIISYGKDRPLVKAHNEKGWAENRRVQFVLR